MLLRSLLCRALLTTRAIRRISGPSLCNKADGVRLVRLTGVLRITAHRLGTVVVAGFELQGLKLFSHPATTVAIPGTLSGIATFLYTTSITVSSIWIETRGFWDTVG